MKHFRIGTFNVRGLKDEQKQKVLADDVDNYRLDICALQETKIKEGVDRNFEENKHRLIAFDSLQQHYGNGFIVAKKWKENIYKTWKVSDRICVLQLQTKLPEQESTFREWQNQNREKNQVYIEHYQE